MQLRSITLARNGDNIQALFCCDLVCGSDIDYGQLLRYFSLPLSLHLSVCISLRCVVSVLILPLPGHEPCILSGHLTITFRANLPPVVMIPSSVFRLPSSIIRDGGRGCLMLSAGHSEWVTLRLSTAYSCTSILLQPLQTDRPIHPTRYLVYCPGLGPSPDQHIFSTLSVL